MDEYILFLDETFKAPSTPYFCLAGFICTRKEYEEKIIPGIDKIKTRNDIPHTLPLHYTDIKNA